MSMLLAGGELDWLGDFELALILFKSSAIGSLLFGGRKCLRGKRPSVRRWIGSVREG